MQVIGIKLFCDYLPWWGFDVASPCPTFRPFSTSCWEKSWPSASTFLNRGCRARNRLSTVWGKSVAPWGAWSASSRRKTLSRCSHWSARLKPPGHWGLSLPIKSSVAPNWGFQVSTTAFTNQYSVTGQHFYCFIQGVWNPTVSDTEVGTSGLSKNLSWGWTLDQSFPRQPVMPPWTQLLNS